MQNRDLYAKLLGLERPWDVIDVDLSLEDHSVQVCRPPGGRADGVRRTVQCVAHESILENGRRPGS